MAKVFDDGTENLRELISEFEMSLAGSLAITTDVYKQRIIKNLAHACGNTKELLREFTVHEENP